MRQTLTNANERATQNQPTMRTKQLGSRLSTNRPTPTNDNSAPRLHDTSRSHGLWFLRRYNSTTRWMNDEWTSAIRVFKVRGYRGLSEAMDLTQLHQVQTDQLLNTNSTGQPLKETTFIDETKRKQLTTQTNQLTPSNRSTHQIDQLIK